MALDPASDVIVAYKQNYKVRSSPQWHAFSSSHLYEVDSLKFAAYNQGMP